jgi:mannose-6-phosphate isomerase-like protein (cupin superfamily)
MKSYNFNEVINTQNGQPVDGDRKGSFWEMLPFEGGSAWVGKWHGESPWEKHSKGDEFLHVIEGHVEVVIITATGKVSASISEGSIFVVPKNHWHKQIARNEVIVLGATPGLTDSLDEEPKFDQ